MQKPGTRVQVINSVEKDFDGHKLALEWCQYIYGPGEKEFDFGFRFIWKKPNGVRLAHRGQACIPAREVVDELWNEAEKNGWGKYDSRNLNKK